MREFGYQEIMSATRPEQIFSMSPSNLQTEYEELCSQFRPDVKFHEIQNFVATQQLTRLYNLAKRAIANDEGELELDEGNSTITLYPKDEPPISFNYDQFIDQGICKTAISDSQVLMMVDARLEDQKGFYSNYLEKVQALKLQLKGEMPDWRTFRHSIPKVVKSFRTQDDSMCVLILQKPYKIYPLRQVLEYFGGRVEVKHVISIVKRLYYTACFIEIAGMSHNGICIDNIYFAPGREVEDITKECGIEDLRIVGLYGGWFFTTRTGEMVKGFPRGIRDIIPPNVMRTHISSYEVDMLSIKKVARELLGDITGQNLFGVHSKLCEWFNRTTCEGSALAEYERFEKLCEEIYGEPKFYGMNISL